MRYWILVVPMYVLFALTMHFVAPEIPGNSMYYIIGSTVCATIALAITWHDPPGILDKTLLFFFKRGGRIAGLMFFAWGIGYKLKLWGAHDPDDVFNDILLPNLAWLTGILILYSAYIRYRRR